MAAVTWEYQEAGGSFRPFSPKEAAAVEAGWAASLRTISLSIGKMEYEVDLEHLVQRNKKTGTERLLRRKSSDGAADVGGRVPVWSWYDAKRDQWVRYYHDISHQIEQSFMKDEFELRLDVPISAHDIIPVLIHLGRFTQQNIASGKVRKIRRTIAIEKLHQTTSGGDGGRRAREDEEDTKAAVGGVAISAAAAAAGGGGGGVAGNSSKEKPASKAVMGAAKTSASAAGDTSSSSSSSLFQPPPFTPVAVKDWKTIHGSILHLPPPASLLSAVKKRGNSNNNNGIKLAVFDLDDTLITTKSGNVFAKTALDWRWVDDSMPERLRKLALEDGFVIVIISNQLGIANDASKGTALMEKVTSMINQVKVNISVFASTREDKYRKPLPFVWTDVVEKMFNEGAAANNADDDAPSVASIVDRRSSFYCGDAAGRMDFHTVAGRAKDFSASDRMFAHNVGLRFLTPEMFLGLKTVGTMSWGDGVTLEEMELLKQNSKAHPKADHFLSKKHPGEQELVIVVARQGSGKSEFSKQFFVSNGYERVNQDNLKTKEKCVKAADEALAAGKSVVVDNTNPGADTRRLYIDVAKKHKCHVRCVWLTTSEAMAKHNNWVRSLFGGGHAPAIAYATYNKNFVEPSMAEGFSEEIVRVPIYIDNTKLSKDEQTALYSLT